MNRLISKLLLTALVMLNVVQLFSQDKKTVSGVVRDLQGPVPGAGVQIKGTKTGTVTDFEGRYEISCETGQALVISCLGYEPVTLTVGKESVYNVSLQTDAEMLDQVVVVGYGVQKKVNVTGSVTSVDYAKLV